MPTRKLINDYTFYKIVNINGDIELCYVGSTVNFNERVRAHRQTCNNKNDKNFNNKLYTTIREHGGWCEFKMIEIGTAEQLTKRQAEKIEEEYRVKLNAKLNSHKCFCTQEEKKETIAKYKKEYRQNNLETFRAHDKEYYNKNKEKRNEYSKEYRENNKEKLAEYYEKNKEQLAEKQKEYYEKNKEKLAAQHKEYREKNKQVIDEKKKKKNYL